MYKAYVTRIKNIQPIENADRLNTGDCFGNTVVISKDYNEKDLYIYFPVDGQLSEQYAEVNNLVRKKDADGVNIGGFLEAGKRNIKAIKLRGQRSDGLVMPLSSLEFTGCDVNEFKNGDTIDVINGIEICCKYVPRQPNRPGGPGNGNKTRKHRAPVAPLFAEHADTEQLQYNLDDFKPGDLIEISLKMHGCFIAGTKVRMGDGSLKEIQKIRPGDSVLGYNLNTKKIESTKVLHTFKNAPSQKWNQLKFSREYIKGDKRGTQTSTWNHKYWVEEKQDWVMAKDLKVGDVVSTLFPSCVLTQMQKEIAIGLFLGDGCLLQFDNRTAEIQVSSKKEHEEFLDWLSELSSNWIYKGQEKISGYGTVMIPARGERSADLYNYMKDKSTFINSPENQRLLPGIVEACTPLSLALWYMGDGSLAHSNQQQDRALLAICRYTTKEDLEIIKLCFNKFNIFPTFYVDSNGYNRIRFNLEETNKFFDLIKLYIPNIMQYKLPKTYQGQFIDYKDTEKFIKKGYVLSPQKVLENIEITQIYDEYDLETELHNYIVGLTIVHNTSQRTAHLPVLKGYKRTLWDRITRKEGTPIYDWGYVSGTRRTVLNDFDGGYYGSNAFREQHSKMFEGKLWRGETIYYEVVGFTDTGVPIMPTAANKKVDKEFVKQYGETTVFSYGCEPTGKKVLYGRDDEGTFSIEEEVPQSDIYVYRMTMTNEDGEVIEYTPDFMRYRCEQMGVKCVPVFWKGYIPEKNMLWTLESGEHESACYSILAPSAGEWIKVKAEEYYDGPDVVGKSHVREGVVVRIVNRPKFTAYKFKSFSFKCLAGIAISEIKDTDNIDADILSEV